VTGAPALVAVSEHSVVVTYFNVRARRADLLLLEMYAPSIDWYVCLVCDRVVA
jgi:hypothetical protein